MTVKYSGITGNDANLDFTVTVTSICIDTPLTASSLLIPVSNQYVVGATALTLTIDDSLISTQIDCPVLEFEITTNGGAALPSPQSFDTSTNEYIVYSTDTSLIGTLYSN